MLKSWVTECTVYLDAAKLRTSVDQPSLKYLPLLRREQRCCVCDPAEADTVGSGCVPASASYWPTSASVRFCLDGSPQICAILEKECSRRQKQLRDILWENPSPNLLETCNR
jgi:hypothetical protein